MGGIGISRREYLYDLSYCDILCIERGHCRRNREMWSATRWQTYYIMLAQCGSGQLKKAHINGPADLIKFPWDNNGGDDSPPVSEEEVKELQDMMRAINRRDGT